MQNGKDRHTASITRPLYRRFRNRDGKRVPLAPAQRVMVRLNSEIELDTHRELKRLCRQYGVTKVRLVESMIDHCLADLQRTEDAIAPF